MLTEKQVLQVLESADRESLPDYALKYVEGPTVDLTPEDNERCIQLAEGIVRSRPDLKLEEWPETIPPR